MSQQVEFSSVSQNIKRLKTKSSLSFEKFDFLIILPHINFPYLKLG